MAVKAGVRGAAAAVHGSCKGLGNEVLGLLFCSGRFKVLESADDLANGLMGSFDDGVNRWGVRCRRNCFDSGHEKWILKIAFKLRSVVRNASNRAWITGEPDVVENTG